MNGLRLNPHLLRVPLYVAGNGRFLAAVHVVLAEVLAQGVSSTVH